MTFPMEQPESPLERRVREQLGDRECPLCGQQAWDFGGARVVFLIGASDGSSLGDYRRPSDVGPIQSPGRTSRSDEEKALRWVSDQLRPVRDAASENRLIQLSCNNCGHTELLDAGKLGS